MGHTYKIRNRNKKHFNLTKKKYNKCRICEISKPSRFHHTMCDRCWRENNKYIENN